MKFFKYQGTGNDFVMVDNRKGGFNDSKENIAFICHRRFGVGADGLILIENNEGFDFRMRYFNADGAEGSMCGNGGRCAVQFASDLGIFENETRFVAVDGPHISEIKDGIVYLHMIDVDLIREEDGGFFVNTGSPHLVIFDFDIDKIDVKAVGASIRYNDYWLARGGVNINFVEITDAGHIKVRTYERGVEDETYSCGTGVTAAAIVSHVKKFTNSNLDIKTLGGILKVSFNVSHKIEDIVLAGPAMRVFEGEF